MDQPLKSPGQSALDDTFHRLFELSRSEPAATLEQRLDRLARLRAVVADNEARFEAAISADFIAVPPRPCSRNRCSCSAKSSTPSGT